jgi:hypothetical protein
MRTAPFAVVTWILNGMAIFETHGDDFGASPKPVESGHA